MRLVITDFISLDGVVQSPGGREEDTDSAFAHGGWSVPFFDPDTMGAAIDQGMDAADALLFGRRTWQNMASAWPDRAGDPYADRMNSIDKYVVSGTLTPADMALWNNSTLIPAGDVARAISRLKDHDGRDILVWGSSELARYLATEDLVDRYDLMIEPIVLGGGKGIFPKDGIARAFTLRNVTQAATGVLTVSYERVRASS
jgi:dihydrofolate reductase